MLGLHDDLGVLRAAIDDFHPHIAFNLLEGFRDFHGFDQHVVAYLELIRQCYTGCNPRGLTLARDKALTKKIMHYHRIHAPAFAVFPRDRRMVRPRKLPFPLLVKSVNVEASIGIARASIVHDDEKLAERVKYIHEALGTYAIAEQYIPGRELYVGVMGNLRLRTFPVWELLFEKAPEDMPLIATNKAKDRWRSGTRERAAKEGVRRLGGPAVVAADELVGGAEQGEQLQWALGQLPEAQRQAILLRYYSDLKFVDIAEILGCPLNTALTRVHKGLIRLRHLMEQERPCRFSEPG